MDRSLEEAAVCVERCRGKGATTRCLLRRSIGFSTLRFRRQAPTSFPCVQRHIRCSCGREWPATCVLGLSCRWLSWCWLRCETLPAASLKPVSFHAEDHSVLGVFRCFQELDSLVKGQDGRHFHRPGVNMHQTAPPFFSTACVWMPLWSLNCRTSHSHSMNLNTAHHFFSVHEQHIAFRSLRCCLFLQCCLPGNLFPFCG